MPPRRAAGLVVAVVAVLMLVAAACGSSSTKSGSPNGDSTTVRIGYFPNVTHAPALVGVDQGIFARDLAPDRLDASQTFNAGPSEVQALLSGSIDIAFIGPSPAVTAYAQSHGAVQIISGAASGGAGAGGQGVDHQPGPAQGGQAVVAAAGQHPGRRPQVLALPAGPHPQRVGAALDLGQRHHRHRVPLRSHRRRLGPRALRGRAGRRRRPRARQREGSVARWPVLDHRGGGPHRVRPPAPGHRAAFPDRPGRHPRRHPLRSGRRPAGGQRPAHQADLQAAVLERALLGVVRPDLHRRPAGRQRADPDQPRRGHRRHHATPAAWAACTTWASSTRCWRPRASRRCRRRDDHRDRARRPHDRPWCSTACPRCTATPATRCGPSTGSASTSPKASWSAWWARQAAARARCST